ncbi:UDP-N-acetylmuramoyl-L-alanyl-D-glutamate--2,6-diaminopimelate ligase [Gluconacetobacter takamatsuzukensis]|uniref:UDP-N-acetylmuramoyl-L-alanyl-D-glutamate--2,6-diaminopimelate ligase n=1 Tax=Gluconacetobacter takamatsuzukensis TaxID=1286190 RepID=A0A7W4KDM7_9PROT|nr:UDP-N-acetylmuramoyl-L-alanyl-D-glutamate--2,6-diaminopimelate ligase [Gluconacetobacter takamatsuzukensis]MBB2204991.1 UDP-N-acetylmuramoyl-L-alanyl-D-glutamate--2,6-diaminopimelate ligase [Gluconacetobacter takamatsuzukensis]
MTHTLSRLLAAAGLPAPVAADPAIALVTADSRKVRPGALFVAIPGTRADGRAFIPAALAAGAAAIVAPSDVPPDAAPGIPLIHAEEPRHALALLAAAFAGPQPGRVVAVTGTNGKTSTVDFLRQIWGYQSRLAASIGTLGIIAPVALPPIGPILTTPDSVGLADTLAAMARGGITDVAIEASSHGLEQHRLDGLHLTAAGFTNLTRDHLDYHGTLDAYRDAKLALFDRLLPEGALAAANADMEPETLAALRAIAARRRFDLRLVGTQGDTIRLLDSTPLPEGQRLRLEVGGTIQDITLALPGRFQADNALLAAALAAPGADGLAQTLALLPALTGVRGRMERAALLPNNAAAYVDYAHTPDALARLLDALRPHATGRLIVVFGAGGDRDRGKRPLMAQEAARRADIAIVTDDNPRTEDPAAIRREVLAGAPGAIEIGDRARAIAEGLSMLRAGDVLVVAGKGHEQGQTIGTTTLPFDDVSVIRLMAGVAA